ncbi:MAG: hypothetical protein MJ252_22555 [archaeon]|nr:hypothetical protein [archaeon]
MKSFLLFVLIIYASARKVQYPIPLKNDPVPSPGCGKQFPMPMYDHFDFPWSQGMRTVRVDFPDNYNNNKPYKLLFGMQCMGGSGSQVQKEGYYGLKPLDTNKDFIFLAPEGNGGYAPWGEQDYKLFDELLAFMKNNACIDESRVFSTGFSYGAMFSNGLSWNHQDVLRAVAVFETAERNIWLPTYLGKPIGWMAVEALQDPICTPEMARHARDIILSHNGPGGSDASKEPAIEYKGSGPHVCYEYQTVDQNYPVTWCTQNGGHMWDHKDEGQTKTWVPGATWDFINRF